MFVNREDEIKRLNQVLSGDSTRIVIIYGRRRCGKSTLLKKVIDDKTVYFAADMRETPLQIKAVSDRIEKLLPGFSAPVYPDWDSLFRNLNNVLKTRIKLVIDEFPYLVKNSPELPSILQNIHDDGADSNYILILCGSSQMMMHGLVLDSQAPLYGRADEIMKIQPMAIAHMKRYLELSGVDAVHEYAVWGGVPRYWEIRKYAGSFHSALMNHVVHQYGLLYDEPDRLFSDELRTSVQAFTLLSLIGSGCHRLSELASRIGKPSTHLSKSLAFLTDLKYIRRELPFGESLRSTKRSLYKINDPFFNFYFTFVLPEKSRIDLGLSGQVLKDILRRMPLYVSTIWEELCRKSVPYLPGLQFGVASRWWGKGINGEQLEIDIISESIDKRKLLIGEARWTDKREIKSAIKNLMLKAGNLPFAGNHEIIPALFLKNKPDGLSVDTLVFDAEVISDILQ